MAKVSDKRLAEWLEQVADGLEAGMLSSDAVALAKALPAELILALESDFRAGKTWGDALSDNAFPFSLAEQSIVEASELSGRLPTAMRRLAEGRRELSVMKRRVGLALAYPIFLLHFAALLFSIMYLVDGDTAGFLVSFGMVVVPVWLIAVFLFAVARVWPNALKSITRVVPIVAEYRSNWDAGTLCEVLASCFAAGLPVDKAWHIALQAADSPRLDRLGESVLAAIERGSKASDGFEGSGKKVPNALAQLYRSGEEMGRLEQNLEAAAKRFFTDAKNKLSLASLLYPKMLLVGIFAYVGYKIITFVSGYYQQLIDINA